MDWYKFHNQMEEICLASLDKDAGLKEDFSAIVFAVSLFLSGMSSAEAAERAKVPQKAVEVAAQNSNIREKAKKGLDFDKMRGMTNEQKKAYLDSLRGPDTASIVSKPNVIQKLAPKQTPSPTPKPSAPAPEKETKSDEAKINISTVIDSVLKHENLLPGQTPFRITSPKMRQWNSIYGYKINKKPDAPSIRTNFLFLKNPSDVPKAVKALFYKYKSNPGRYGLSNKSTLKQVLEVFDQSGAAGKMAFLKKEIPGLDVNKPFSNFF